MKTVLPPSLSKPQRNDTFSSENSLQFTQLKHRIIVRKSGRRIYFALPARSAVGRDGAETRLSVLSNSCPHRLALTINHN